MSNSPIFTYDPAPTAKLGETQTFTKPQRGTITVDNDLSFDMDTTNDFKCTPTSSGTLTFTSLVSDQVGNIWFDNSGGHVISAAASVIISPSALATISTAGVYWLSYYCDGTEVAVTASPALTSSGA